MKFPLAAAAIVAALAAGPVRAADAPRMLPAPAIDTPAGERADSETAVLAGGCFWGIQGVFQRVKGVQQVLSGYAGGSKETAFYEQVGSGTTGHAESVQIRFDPKQISYGEILHIFFSVALDPTELDRQGPDDGPQYRSDIFAANATQQRIAQSYVAQLDQAHVFGSKIVTRVDAATPFYPAEDYHQDYLLLHPTSMYIVINDLPKVAGLKKIFPDRYLDTPRLSRPAS